ncbi:diacylglycerol/lipid kinase family protein [Actinophytocola sp.]|uniref:diacylglycerol/lipid kinase family protein n=1 Tax=Actinophytocola sp. TaxID=1872138 RepID=UPI002D7EBB04|nr:diacylglycerol kinase family protein [Actinophytocola sp.]HET9139835.1 diacylglycerol kinase family protein [Actinophytocola sp.]
MRALIIVNPAARGLSPDLAGALEALCRNRFTEVEVRHTTGADQATALAAGAPAGCVVFAVGGDGTAREVVHGLAGAAASMFIVPAGTANSCYRSFWGETAWPDALDAALADPAGHTRHLDLARLAENGKLVLAGASTGFPAQAIHRAESLTDLTGRARYERALLDLAATFRPYPGRVTVDGVEVHNGPTMLANAGGSRYRGGQFEVLPHSVIDDGLLDVCVIGGTHDPAEMLGLARAGRHVTRSGVVYARGRRVTFERTDGEPLWFEHDGEVLPAANGAFTLDVLPAAVAMLVGPAADLGRRSSDNRTFVSKW